MVRRIFVNAPGRGCRVLRSFLDNDMGFGYRVMSHLEYLGWVRMMCLASHLLLRWGEDVMFCLIFFMMRWA